MQEQVWRDPRSWSITSKILSSRTLLWFWIVLQRNTQNCAGIMGTFLNDPPAQELQPSSIFNNSKNLASSSQDVRADISETARRDMKRESLNTPTQKSHFQSGNELCLTLVDLILTVWWIIREFLFRMESLEKILTVLEVQKLEAQLQNWSLHANNRTSDHNAVWVKEVEAAKSIDELRDWLQRPHCFPDFDMLDAVVASASKKLLNTQSNFRKRREVSKSKRTQNSAPISCEEDKLHAWSTSIVRTTRAYEAVQGLSDLFAMSLQNDDVQDFDVSAFRPDPERITQSQNNRTPPNFGLWWLCMIKKLLGIMENRTVKNLKTAVKLHIDQLITL